MRKQLTKKQTAKRFVKNLKKVFTTPKYMRGGIRL